MGFIALFGIAVLSDIGNDFTAINANWNVYISSMSKVGTNVIEASWEALSDAYLYGLIKGYCGAAN